MSTGFQRVAPRRRARAFIAVLSVLFTAAATELAAQVVTTGNLRVETSDEAGLRIEGVKVTLTGAALIEGAMERTTSSLGQAFFPVLPPGLYALRFEKAGHGTVVRDQVVVDIGLTYAVRVVLKPGSPGEVTTISGSAPALDESTAEVGTTIGAEHLENIPTSRDVWAVMQQAPRMRMMRFDVGGSTTGTQTGYKNFGFGDQNRPMLDGVNLTEGTSGSGFYFDYGTFEQVNISGMGNNAEMPTPGTGYSMVIKSGGNALHGMFFQDYESPKFQSDNLTDELKAPWPQGQGIQRGDKLKTFWTNNWNIGGPVLKNRVWFFLSALIQKMEKEKIGYGLRPGDPTRNDNVRGFMAIKDLKGLDVAKLLSPTGKITVLPTANDRIVFMMADSGTRKPERSGDVYHPAESTYNQASNGYARKLGWMHAFGSSGLLDVTVGLGGYRWPDFANSEKPPYQDIVTRQYTGSRWEGLYQNYDPKRWQFYPTMTLFVDNWLGGNHDFKFGFTYETYGAERHYAGHPDNVRYYLYNGAPYQVDLMNTPTRYSYSTDTIGAFVSDTFTVGKWALNLGLRYDEYRADLPDMTWPGNNWAGLNPLFAAQEFPGSKGLVHWRNVAPRIGVTYLINEKTVAKVSWGRYWFNPGLITASANKNTLGGAVYSWTDVNGNRLLDPGLGEIGSLVRQYGARVAEIDPELPQPYGDEFFVSVDREMDLLGGLSVRGLYLYKRIERMWQTVNGEWPYDAYEAVRAPELDERGNATGNEFTLYNLKPQFRGLSRDLVTSLGSYDRNHNIELVVRKRMSAGWQLMSSLDLTWERQPYLARAGTSGSSIGYGAAPDPNGERFLEQKFLQGVFKLSATFDAPFDVSISPVFRYQLGEPWGRRAIYRNYTDSAGKSVAFNQGEVYLWMEEQNSRRLPNVALVDFRAEKTFRLPRDVSVGLMFDLFNIFNSNAMTATTDMTGVNFNKWTEILLPRVYRLGFRVTF